MRDSEKRKFQAKVVIWSMLLCLAIVVIATYTEYVKREAVKEQYRQIKAQVLIDITKEMQDNQARYVKELSK
jgi:uncharacterized membrane protein